MTQLAIRHKRQAARACAQALRTLGRELASHA